jgi:Tol biopolymer transport system component
LLATTLITTKRTIARLIGTGETHTFKRPADLAGVLVWFPNAWFPDGARFIAVSVKSTAQGGRLTSWLVTILGGTTTLLRDDADAQAVSPDGSMIAFTTGGHETDRDVWVMGPRGENPRRIRAGGEFTTFRSLQWSPRGQRLAYSKAYAAGNNLWEYTIESCDLKGEAVTVIVPGLAGQAGLCWMPDGRIIYSIDERAANNENTNLWEIRADPTTGQARGRAHSITNWLAIHTDRFSFSADGKRMVVQKSWGLLHAFIGRLQADGGLETLRRLTLEDSHDVPLAWTADSKAVVFSSDRTGVWKLYRQALDQAQAEPLTTGPDENRFARLSPDGRWVLYSSRARDGTQFARYIRVSISGGPPELVMQTQPSTARYRYTHCP